MKKFLICAIFLGITLSSFAYNTPSDTVYVRQSPKDTLILSEKKFEVTEDSLVLNEKISEIATDSLVLNEKDTKEATEGGNMTTKEIITIFIFLCIIERFVCAMLIDTLACKRKMPTNPWIACCLTLGWISLILLTILYPKPEEVAERRLAIEEKYEQLKNKSI